MERCLLDRMQTARGLLHTVSVSGGSDAVELVPASSIRGSLTFFGAALQYELALVGANSKTNVGIIVPQWSATPVVLTLQFHGDLVQQCFYVHAAAPVTITWAEAIFQGS